MSEAVATSGAHRGAGFLRAILERFRGRGGVPAAARDDLALELAPLFLVLDTIEAEASQVREEAAQRAAAIDEATRREVDEIFAEAERQAKLERAKAAAVVRRVGEAEVQALDERAEAEAAEVTRIGQERLATLVAAVQRCVSEAAR